MPAFYTTDQPAAKQHVLRAMKAIDAKLRKGLAQSKKEDAKWAVLNNKLALANLQMDKRSGADLSTLSAQARSRWRQRRGITRSRAKVGSRPSDIPVLERSSIVIPPYSYDWST